MTYAYRWMCIECDQPALFSKVGAVLGVAVMRKDWFQADGSPPPKSGDPLDVDDNWIVCPLCGGKMMANSGLVKRIDRRGY